MKISTLISKLQKLKVDYKIEGSYNKDIIFKLKGKVFKAGFRDGLDTIDDYCREIGYDNANQEKQRIFFDNFSQVLRNANR